MNQNLSTLTAIMEARGVKRYHTEYVLREQTLDAHSWGVAVLALHLSNGYASANLLKEALMHDMHEKHTGDPPYPVKKNNPLLKSAYDMLAESFNGGHETTYELSATEQRILKFADMADLMFYCCVEAEMGNTKIHDVFMNGLAALRHLAHSVKEQELITYFIDRFGGAIE